MINLKITTAPHLSPYIKYDYIDRLSLLTNKKKLCQN